MQYSSLLVAAAAFAGVAAQNATLPPGVQNCCTVPASTIPQNLKSSWCLANQNTCPELCGGQANIASGGNDCNATSLVRTCECRNGTKPDMTQYQQSVDALMCRYWFSGCINATNQDAGLQFTCTSIRDQQCGNKVTSGAATTSGSSSTSALPSRTSSAGGSTGTGAASSSSSTPGAAAALGMVREYSTPLLAGGLAAVFGLVL